MRRTRSMTIAMRTSAVAPVPRNSSSSATSLLEKSVLEQLTAEFAQLNTQQLSDDASSECSSNYEVEPETASGIFVSITPNGHKGFVINVEQRPDTLQDGQGDHFSSYILIIQALVTSAGKKLKMASQSLRSLAKELLEPAVLQEFMAIQRSIVHTSGSRKALFNVLTTNSLVAAEIAKAGISADQIKLFNKELKDRKMEVYTKYLAAQCECLLRGLQKHPLTTAFSKGR